MKNLTLGVLTFCVIQVCPLLLGGCSSAPDDTTPTPSPSPTPANTPVESEVCDGQDNNGNGQVDEGLTTTSYYLDQDGDGDGALDGRLESCARPSGYVENADDCNDANPQANLHQEEVCDTVDNDCDAEIDEGVMPPGAPQIWFFQDADLDGFGSDQVGACAPLPGFIAVRGDCNDDDPTVYPGAIDGEDDVDSDCGGTVLADPHLGLNSRSILTLQAAIEAAQDGQTLWIGPGTYLESYISIGKQIALKSTHLADHTIIDAGLQARAFTLNRGETSDTVLDGLTITNGRDDTWFNGGAVYHWRSSPTLRNCVLDGNTAPGTIGQGGALYLDDSQSLISHCTLRNNVGVEGGGVFSIRSDARIHDCVIEDGSALSGGGGICFRDSRGSLLRTQILRNSAGVYGGGLQVDETSAITVSESLLQGNRTDYRGGGIYLQGAQAIVTDSAILQNEAAEAGGGLYADPTTLELLRVSLRGNQARTGGGIYQTGTGMHLMQSVVLENRAHLGGGIYLLQNAQANAAVIHNSILAYSVGHNLYLDDQYDSDDIAPILSYSILHNPFGLNHTLTALPPDVLTTAPGFERFPSDLDLANDDLHLSSGASARDAGDPATSDPDGSRADIGLYGGEGADFSWYVDADGDGMFDGWELSHDLDPSVKDADGDADSDGLTNVQEFTHHTLPTRADSDGDTHSDKVEVDAPSDPLNPCSIPGTTGLVAVEVGSGKPFTRLQDAINAIPLEGNIEVGAGTFTEKLYLGHKRLTLRGQGSTTVLKGAGATVLTAVQSELELSDLTLQGGTGNLGGGLSLTYVSGTLSDIQLSQNTATSGGGGYLMDSALTFERVTVQDNAATAMGGGLYLEGTTAPFTDVTIARNSASQGGGIYGENAQPSILNSHFTDNTSTGAGGGMFCSSCTISVEDTTFEANQSIEGGGLYLLHGSSELLRTTWTDNRVSADYGRAGALLLDGASVHVDDSLFSTNSASDGGAVASYGSSNLIENSQFLENEARNGGAFLLTSADVSTFEGNTFADNVATQQGGAIHTSYSTPALIDNVIVRNSAAGAGGGLYAYVSSGRWTGTFHSNVAGTEGGNIYALLGAPQLESLHVQGGEASLGAGVYLEGAAGSFASSRIEDCVAAVAGGGLYLNGGSTVLDNLMLVDNIAAELGGGAVLKQTTADVNHLRATGNAANKGGGFYLENVSSKLSSILIHQNTAHSGGAWYLKDSSPRLYNSIAADNIAVQGGGLYAEGASSAPQVRSTIFASNAGFNVYLASDPSGTPAPVITYSSLYTASGDNHNLPSLDATNLLVDPTFLAYSMDGKTSDFHLSLTSPVINKGDAFAKDVDGSTTDMGIYGASLGATWNLDGDNVPDYFWPGEWANAPVGFTAEDYDCEDGDGSVQACTD